MRDDVVRPQVVTILAIAVLAAMAGACDGGTESAGQTDEAAQGPSVLVTVANDRQVDVDGKVFGNGQHKAKPAKGAPPGRTLVRVGDPGKLMAQVSMRSAPEDSLVLVHVDASTPDRATILVYGAYGSEMASMNQAQSTPTAQAALLSALDARAAVSGWECIWCRGGVLACGVEPQCGSGGAGGDSID